MKQLLFPVFLALMVMGTSAEAMTAQKLSMEDSIVFFTPEVSLTEGGLPCQGVIKETNGQIVVQTLPDCAFAMARLTENQSFMVYRIRGTLVGTVMQPDGNQILQGHLNVDPSADPLAGAGNFPSMDQGGTTAYYIINHGEHLVNRPVDLGERSVTDDEIFYQLEGEGLPPGASISHQGQLLCLASGFGQCLEISSSASRNKRSLSKRQEEEMCELMLTGIQCDNVMLDGGCIGTCMHMGFDESCAVNITGTTETMQTEMVTCGDCLTTYHSNNQTTLYMYENSSMPNGFVPECFAMVNTDMTTSPTVNSTMDNSALAQAASLGSMALLLTLATFMH